MTFAKNLDLVSHFHENGMEYARYPLWYDVDLRQHTDCWPVMCPQCIRINPVRVYFPIAASELYIIPYIFLSNRFCTGGV